MLKPSVDKHGWSFWWASWHLITMYGVITTCWPSLCDSDVIDSGPFRMVSKFLNAKPYAKSISQPAMLILRAMKIIKKRWRYTPNTHARTHAYTHTHTYVCVFCVCMYLCGCNKTNFYACEDYVYVSMYTLYTYRNKYIDKFFTRFI